MYTAPKPTTAIPGIWAEAVLDNLRKRLMIDPFREEFEREWQEHQRRLADDPEYARAYEEREAADATEDYWNAFFDNWFPPECDEDEEDW